MHFCYFFFFELGKSICEIRLIPWKFICYEEGRKDLDLFDYYLINLILFAFLGEETSYLAFSERKVLVFSVILVLDSKVKIFVRI